jgi:hypothetical protein
MKKIFIGCCLLFSSASAFCDWSYIAESTGGDSYYIDAATAKKLGNSNVRVWILENYIEPLRYANIVAYSSKTLRQVDCLNQRHKILSNNFYSQAMGKGAAVHISNEETNWSYSAPDSVFAAVVNAACNRAR